MITFRHLASQKEVEAEQEAMEVEQEAMEAVVGLPMEKRHLGPYPAYDDFSSN